MPKWICLIATIAVVLVTCPALAQRSTPIQLLHPSGAASDKFGSSVAVDGDTMVVAATLDDVGANSNQGSAHVYRWTGSGWVFEATLTASDGASDDKLGFGRNIAISGDTVVVGAYSDDVAGNIDQGSVYVFIRTPGSTTWSQQAQLTAADGAASDFFGYSVALSGDTVIVSAFGDNVGANTDQGSAYVFVRSGATWAQQAKLTASDGATNDQFGSSVALSGDTAIVGAFRDDFGANADQGSAYVFVRSGANWSQQNKLTASDGAGGDALGWSVAISGDTAIVGAYLDTVGSNTGQGSAYIFTRPFGGTTWSQQAKLTASDGAAIDVFGVSVALSGDTALVGALNDAVGGNDQQGSAYTFVRSGTTWTQQAKLIATGGAAGDHFGSAVALSGDTALVGVPDDQVGANMQQGSAWVFSRIGNKWIGPDLAMFSSDGAAGDNAGFSVAISGDTAIVGAPNDDVGANANQGSAYIFVRSSSATWSQQAKLAELDVAPGSQFGRSVAISGNTAVVGAPFFRVGTAVQGAALVFVRSGTTWTRQAQLLGRRALDQFGFAVALSGDTAIVGVPRYNSGSGVPNLTDQGAAYVFVRSGTTWSQQALLTAADTEAFDLFGTSVAISGDTAIVGAPFQLPVAGGNTDTGSAYIFVRTPSGTTWSQQAQLNAASGALRDQFGISVAISDETAIVGAYADDVGSNADQGSAYVFVRNPGGNDWTQQAQLIAADGAAGDSFGYSVSVSVSGDAVVVGAIGHNVGANTDQGVAYGFARMGDHWTPFGQFTSAGGAAGDAFGVSVAVSGDTAIVGAITDDVGSNIDQGSAWSFDLPPSDLALVRNETIDTEYQSLLAALTPAGSGQQITATQAAWRSATAINTAGRRLGLSSTGDLRTPSTCALTLGAGSVLASAPSGTAEIYGPLSVPAAELGVISSGAFRFGSSGTLRVFSNALLVVDALDARVDGRVQLDPRGELQFRNNVITYGSVTVSAFADASANGSIVNYGAWSVNNAIVGAQTFINHSTLAATDSALFSDLVNNSGAATLVTSGDLFVAGSVFGDGAILTSTCVNCPAVPSIDVSGNVSVGAAATLGLSPTGASLRVGGGFDCAINSNSRYDMSVATLHLEGSGPEQTLEVMSTDIGPNASGIDRALAGHYPIHTLHIGPSYSTVRLVDSFDNDGLGQGSCEAIYVDTLRIDAGSRLINTSCRIYYKALINNGTIDVPANVIPLAASCPGDLNADTIVDDADFQIFVVAYDILDCAAPSMPAGCPSDLNNDAIVDDADFQVFVVAYNAVLCP